MNDRQPILIDWRSVQSTKPYRNAGPIEGPALCVTPIGFRTVAASR